MMTTKGKKGLSDYLRSLETTEKKDCYVPDVVVTEERGCNRIKEGSGKCAICRRNKNNAGIPCY